MTRLKGYGAIVLVALPLTAGLAACGDQTEAPAPAPPVAVRVASPMLRTMGASLQYMGRVQSRREVKVIAQAQGTVRDLPFDEGQSVVVGDTVARLAVPDLQALADRLRADRDYWCERYRADERLVAASALPREQMRSSQRACRTASAALTEAESRLARALETSPLAGKVLARFVEPGQAVMPGQPLLLLGSDGLEIRVEVVEEDLSRGIAVGIAAEVEVGSQEPFQAAVTQVAPMSSGAARTFAVTVPAPSTAAAPSRRGAAARVRFLLESGAQVIAVPVAAVNDRDRNPHVFAIRAQRAVRQAVEPGIEQDGWVEVAFAWNGTDVVAVSNLSALSDGVTVYAVPVQE